MIGMSVGQIIIEEPMTILGPKREDNRRLESFTRSFRVCGLHRNYYGDGIYYRMK